MFLIVLGCLLAVIGAQNLGTPRNAGPDEPAHIVRGAGLVRGDVFGTRPEGPIEAGAADIENADASNDSVREFDVPRWVAEPSEKCFAHDPAIPAGCSTVRDVAGTGVISTAATYPIWSHVLPGLATLIIPNSSALWLARLLHGLIPAVLLAGSLTQLLARRRGVAASAVLLALTPMTLFLFATVNPSGIALAGAVAFWVAGDELFRIRAAPSWLLPAGYAALVLPRDDGLLWAGLTIGLLWFVSSTSPIDAWRSLSATARVVIGAVTAVGAGWALLVGGDLVPVDRPASGIEFAEIVVERTGRHLREAVGVLGWLDTSIPESAFALWCCAAGLVVMVPLVLRRNRRALGSVAALVLFVVVAWLLEIVQGRTAGLFWQGRYGLPMLMGFVLIAGLTSGADRVIGRVASFVPGVVAVVVWNFAFLQALRRWGVGENGSIRPWAWDTWGAPVPVVALIALHVGASVGLLWVCWRDLVSEQGESRDEVGSADRVVPAPSGTVDTM